LYELHDVSRQFERGGRRVDALSHVSCTIGDGELLAIQGPTGQGKTTLLQLLGGLDRPSSGSVVFDGQDLARCSEPKLARLRAKAFGFIFQTFNLMPTLSARENVEVSLVPLGVSAAERRARAAEALEQVGLAERATHLPGELSGGQQQRVAIARALVKNPRVVLADEPTGNLDEEMRDDVMSLLEKMWRDRGITLILVTHDGWVARRAPKLGTIKKGSLTIRAAAGATAKAPAGLM
jgi:putative ABC transport system ATP-binding protein